MVLATFHEFIDIIELKVVLGLLDSVLYITIFSAGVGILGGEITYIMLLEKK